MATYRRKVTYRRKKWQHKDGRNGKRQTEDMARNSHKKRITFPHHDRSQ